MGVLRFLAGRKGSNSFIMGLFCHVFYSTFFLARSVAFMFEDGERGGRRIALKR